MRLIVARCEVRYSGRLTAVLPDALRLIMIKSDGSMMVHADTGGLQAAELRIIGQPESIGVPTEVISQRSTLALFGAAVAAVALYGCGDDQTTNTAGVVIPDGAQGDAERILRSNLENEARHYNVRGPDDVQCEAVAHVQARPIDQQYDFRCDVIFPNGRTMECEVPAKSTGQTGCTPSLVNEAPYPAIYQRNID